MPKTCSICNHPKVAKINAAIISGASYRDISGHSGVSKSSLERHRPHIAKAIAKAKTARAGKEAVQAETLLDRLLALHQDTKSIFREARKSKDLPSALRAIARLEQQIVLEMRLLAEEKQNPVNDPNALIPLETVRRAIKAADEAERRLADERQTGPRLM